MSKSSLVHTQEKQEEFLRRLQEGEYAVEKTAELVGVTRQAVYSWKRNNPDFALAVDSLQEVGHDEKTERIEQNIAMWAENPTFKVGMVNFLAAMAWLKAHKPNKWNEKSFKHIDQKITINRVEVIKDYGKKHIEAEVREIPYESVPVMLDEGIDPV